MHFIFYFGNDFYMTLSPHIDTWFWQDYYDDFPKNINSLENSFNHETIIVPDLHGNFEAYKHILLKAELIDNNFNWKWWNTHVIFLWDIIFDRNKQWTQILLSIDELDTKAKLEWGSLEIIAWNHEDVGIDAIAYYYNIFDYYTSLQFSKPFAWIKEFNKYITDEKWMLAEMKKTNEWIKLLEIISSFNLIKRVWNSLLTHTHITSKLVDLILQYGIDNINSHFKAHINAILYPEKEIKLDNNFWKEFRTIFLDHSNRDYYDLSHGQLLQKSWIKASINGHSYFNCLKLEQVSWINNITIDCNYWWTTDVIPSTETFAKITKKWRIYITSQWTKNWWDKLSEFIEE